MEWSDLARRQDGVVARSQLVELGLGDHDVRRLVRRRELARVHAGVYLTHTGMVSWSQRAWGAVLYFRPAVLWGPAALVADRIRPEPSGGPVHVAVDERRRVGVLEDVVVHRVSDLDARARWHLSPPRTRIEHSVLDAASAETDELGRVAILTEALQSRRVTVGRLLTELSTRTRLPHRVQLAALLADLEAGTESVLEHGYTTRVERAHGLPSGRRQARVGALAARHDVVYEAARTIVELDGRAYHSVASQRSADLDRDTAALAAGYLTLRLGWGQVFSSPCRTAIRVGQVLRQRGWSGSPRRCADCP